jgi:hypothetical protein
MILVLLILFLFSGTLAATDSVVSREFITEPPTLISLGFEWHIEGDDNRSAAVGVFYRKKAKAPGNKACRCYVCRRSS